jgi:hypothetical protein
MSGGRKYSGEWLLDFKIAASQSLSAMRTDWSKVRWLQLFLVCLLAIVQTPYYCQGGGVTVITHGYNSDVNGWVTAMADAIPGYIGFSGTNFTTYKITLTTDGNGNYQYQYERTNGVAPALSDSGEIIVKLDWSQMSGGLSTYDISTYDVAWVASWVLMQTNAIAELSGHALAEFPLHLIGHSRGGSLVTEMSRILGTNGIWIDHLTTLDAHPLNNDGNFDLFFPTDASASNTYVNVLFRDNYWQDFPGGFLDFNGESVGGAYDRHLTDLSGGYNNTTFAAPYHSNVHLWYHGTVSWVTPVSDGDATITSTERQAWWVADEQAGTNAGFEYSLIAAGNRLSAEQPLGPGFPAINDGYNRKWDLGAGISNNRVSLGSNNGQWPNIIKCNVSGTNVVQAGDQVAVTFYYQYGGGFSNAQCRVYFDADFNPNSFDEILVFEGSLTNTGVDRVVVKNAGLNTALVSPGSYNVLVEIASGSQTRFAYAPEPVTILPSRVTPSLDIAVGPPEIIVGVNGASGQRIALQVSSDLQNWLSVATNALTSNRWIYTNTSAADDGRLFYRAELLP